MNALQNSSELLTEDQFRAEFGLKDISDRTLYSLRKSGKIPYVALSKRTIRYPRAAVEKAIEAMTQGGTL